MAENIKDLYNFFEVESIKRAGNGYIAHHVRKFVREFGKDNSMDTVVEDAMWHMFCSQFPSIEVKKSYFHSICFRAWETVVDEDTGITYIHLKKQNIVKSRNRKI